MPVETFDGLNNGNTRKNVTHLEALGRSFDGISAWLNLPPDDTEEGQLRAKYTNLVVKSIANAVNPESPDYMRFDGPGGQPFPNPHSALFSKCTLLDGSVSPWKAYFRNGCTGHNNRSFRKMAQADCP